MAFLTEPEPPRGQATQSAPGVRRLVANNPGPMTYHGTNTYLLEGADGLTIVDPGPDDPAHLADILAQGRIARIIVTHAHHDHYGALEALRAATGAPVFARAQSLRPDHDLPDGAVLEGWTALHTPGHAPDHVCLARADGVLLSADVVMGWSTTVVSPPEGDMIAYFDSLARLSARQDQVFLPGHGPAIGDPAQYLRFLRDHRLGREQAILDALAREPSDIPSLVLALYLGLAERLRPMAARSVEAHLRKLEAESRAAERDGVWFIP